MAHLFSDKVASIAPRLIVALALTKNQAAGVLGNIGHETAGFALLREVGARPGQGGYGWGQWTGARRAEYLRFCGNRDWRGDEPNMAFLVQELLTTENRALGALRRTETVEDATRVFAELYERPGVMALPSRIRYAIAARSAMECSG